MSPSIYFRVLATTLLTPLIAAHYTLTSDLSGPNFFPNFTLFSSPDPTNGFVAYQPLNSAVNTSLIGYLPSPNTNTATPNIYLGVDSTNPTPSGRPSIRAESKNSYNHGLLLADIRHMPASTCGVWPAFWLLGEGTWPMKGEIDILEGVNDQVSNAITLHTSSGCVVDNKTTTTTTTTDNAASFSGEMLTANCDVQAPTQDKNQGCSILAPASVGPTYGTDFNSVGGGIYAVEWTTTSINVWFFARNSPAYTQYFANPNPNPNPNPATTSSSEAEFEPKNWGTPLARFAGANCDFEQRFRDLRIVFNTAFCGEWAGRQEVWDRSCRAETGVATCEEYVRDRPEAFREAYWEIEGLRWYEEKGGEEKVVGRGMGGMGGMGGVHQKGREYKW